MARSSRRLQLAFPITIVVTLAVVFLPADWRLPWQRDLAQIVQFPFRPFYDLGNILAARLRPAPSLLDTVSPDHRDLATMIEERDRAQRRFVAEHQHLLELQDQLLQLQQIPPETLRAVRHPIVARITRRSPDTSLGLVELKLPSQLAAAVWPDTTAVYAGVHLLGRTVQQPSGNSCLMLPVVNRASGFIRARVFPKDRPLADGRLIQVHPTGTGAFLADVERDVVFVGDRVRLDDPAWPRSAQAMVLGDVQSVDVNDAEPLRNTITVRPLFHVSQVATVTLLVEGRPESAPGPTRRGEP